MPAASARDNPPKDKHSNEPTVEPEENDDSEDEVENGEPGVDGT